MTSFALLFFLRRLGVPILLETHCQIISLLLVRMERRSMVVVKSNADRAVAVVLSCHRPIFPTINIQIFLHIFNLTIYLRLESRERLAKEGLRPNSRTVFVVIIVLDILILFKVLLLSGVRMDFPLFIG